MSLSIRGRLQSQLSPLCVLCYKLTCVKIYLKSHIFILGRKQQHIEAREKEKNHFWSSFTVLHVNTCTAQTAVTSLKRKPLHPWIFTFLVGWLNEKLPVLPEDKNQVQCFNSQDPKCEHQSLKLLPQQRSPGLAIPF